MNLDINEISVFEAILARRSVREYTSQKVDAKRIRSLVEAAVMAPTAMHKEPWAFVVIQDKNRLKALSDRAKPMFIEQLKQEEENFDVVNNPTFNIFYDASTLIIIGTNKKGPFNIADCWLASENLMLAACAMELGSCVIGAALPALNDQEGKRVLGVADDFEAVAPIVVGFPRGEPETGERKRPLILNWL